MALTILSFQFSGLLYPIRGGSEYTLDKSILLITLQYFWVIADMSGRRGSKETTKTGLLLEGLAYAINLIALALGIILALCPNEAIIILFSCLFIFTEYMSSLLYAVRYRDQVGKKEE